MLIFDVLAPFDLLILKFFNVTCAHPWLDQFWLTITRLHKIDAVRYLVFPVILVAMLWRFKAHALKPLLMVGVAVGLCDTLSYRVIKSHVARPRPFDNPAIAGWVRPVGKAHGSSFPSNHAANTFAAAGVLAAYFERRRNLFYVFAFLVGLSRIALGVHYPTDVLAGMVLGSTIAFFVDALIVQRYKALWIPSDAHLKSVANRPTSGRHLRT